MFGYVIADLARLDEAQRTRYKSVYCGLCRALFHSYGPVPALALTYDMAFLTLFLSALYEPAEKTGAARCLRHPAQAQSWTQTELTGYAAARFAPRPRSPAAAAAESFLSSCQSSRRFS